jgi:MrcB-like, N-terminal domain
MPGGKPPLPNNQYGNDPLRKGLTAILDEYVVARAHEPLDSGHYLWSISRELQSEFLKLSSISSRPNLVVRWSLGQGSWARIPWFAFLDRRETKGTSGGVYVIYLFRQDMSGVYLTLNQGITKEKEARGVKDGRHFVRQRAGVLRQLCKTLVPIGFSLTDDIDLHSDGSVGVDYRCGTIAQKFYASKTIPGDEILHHDLEHALRVYDTFLSEKLRGTHA